MKPTCSTCGAALPDDAPGGLCPQCLAQTVLSPGDRIQYFGNYELVEEVGLGGMGIVWRAQQTGLNRTVALKMIRGGMLADADDVRRFYAEAEAAANLQHPNIVAIHEIGEFEGQHYYSMDFVEGKNLAELCDGKPLPARRAAELIATIADAVQFAHQRGILHRDLKPQNVMIDEHGAPRLTDFGLAKRLDRDSGLTQTGAVLGSPSYMAPEQAQGRTDRIAPHTDVYSLGAILYEMLTGRAPFRADSPAETMMRVINDEPAAPSKRNADVPRDLETICLKCLEKDPARRYATARELAEDTRRFLGGEPIVARPASALRKAESWLRRRPALIGGLGAVLIFGLIFWVLYLAEQNAFLRAQQLTPGLVRAPGERLRSLLLWEGFGGIVFLNAAVWTSLWRNKHARRGAWKDLFNREQDWRPRHPVPPRVIAVCAFVWITISAFGVMFLVKLIQTQVWEGGVTFLNVFMALILPFLSGALLLNLWQDYRRGVEGARSRNLRPDDLAAIRAAVEAFDLPRAIKLYRKAVPEAGAAEANEYAMRLAEEFREAQPEKFVALANRPWWEVNPRAMALCAAIEGAAVAAYCVLFPPADPVRFASGMATSFVFGAVMMISTRLKGFTKRFLVVLIPMLAMSLGGELIRRSTGVRDSSVFMPGILLGMIFMLSAYMRSRPRTVS
jgi:hypothetical protein